MAAVIAGVCVLAILGIMLAARAGGSTPAASAPPVADAEEVVAFAA